MLSGKPLFPGSDYHNQLWLIIEILGTPMMEDYNSIKSRRAKEYIRTLPFRKKQDFVNLFPNANPQAVDLLEKLLTFNPKKRLTVEQALEHPYVSFYHEPNDEPIADKIPDDFFDFDKRKDELSLMELKKMLYDEIMKPLHN
ncbi:unnamed protein product [[Candida] boidinii]|nr:unnamed protein product [[Candida] boidinii]GMG21672.1 unnamed protein product [[Candida] boidinii]